MSLSGSSPFEALKVSSKQVYMQDMAFIAEIKRSHVLSFALIFRYLTVIFFDDRELLNSTISFWVLSSVAL